jgi:hypothetical protein
MIFQNKGSSRNEWGKSFRWAPNGGCFYGLRRQSAAATALLSLAAGSKIPDTCFESGVALRLPPQSETWRDVVQPAVRASGCIGARIGNFKKHQLHL